MTNSIANKKSICNASLSLLAVSYTGILLITNRMLKTWCIKDNKLIVNTLFSIITLYRITDQPVHLGELTCTP